MSIFLRLLQSLKACSSMEVNVSGKVIFCKFLQFIKAVSEISVNFWDSLISLSELQFLKAELLIRVTLSERDTFVKAEKSRKQVLPRDVIPSETYI